MMSRAAADSIPGRARVLIVDDDERNAFAAREALEVLGHDLVVARSGEEALRILLNDDFAVILLDLHMPGMDGYETARLIREHPRTRDTPIVFVTAVFRDEAHVFQAYSVGAVDLVFKPADPFILRSKVAILVDLYLKTLEVRRQAEESRRLMEENARVSAEKLLAEKALRRSVERQDAILQSLPVVFTSRLSTHPFAARFVSDSITPMTGFTPDRFIDEPEIGLGRIHPEDVAGVVDCLMKAAETGAYACEYRWLCADGTYRTFLDQGVWVQAGDGGEEEILGTLLDVTERRNLEEQLNQARKMEAVGQLTGGVAHDFNNLLTVVLGNADILLRRYAEDERLTRQLASIRAAAERGQTLTRQLLAFSRKQVLNPAVIDVNALIKDFVPLIQQAVGGGVTLQLDLSDQSANAFVDPTHLENALLNLAVNARDAMKGIGELTLRTGSPSAESVEDRQLVQISVRDSGMGMSQDVIDRIFEPFFTTKDIGVGTGLGLSQVHGFVTQSGGRVEVSSCPGEGTEILISLPFSMERASDAKTEVLDRKSYPGTGSILVVEDDPSVLALCLDMLEGLGYECDKARSAAEALDLLEAGKAYDVLFSDVVMPGGLNGVQLAEKARSIRPNLKVLLTSGYVDDDTRQIEHEFTLLNKPYKEFDLSVHLKSMIESNVD